MSGGPRRHVDCLPRLAVPSRTPTTFAVPHGLQLRTRAPTTRPSCQAATSPPSEMYAIVGLALTSTPAWSRRDEPCFRAKTSTVLPRLPKPHHPIGGGLDLVASSERATRGGRDRARSGSRGPSGRSAYDRALGCRKATGATGARRGQPRRVHGGRLHRQPRSRASPPEDCERIGRVRQHVGRRANFQRVGRGRSASHEPRDDGCPGGIRQRDLRRLRIPVKVISDSGLNVISDSGQSDHRWERSDAGVGL